MLLEHVRVSGVVGVPVSNPVARVELPKLAQVYLPELRRVRQEHWHTLSYPEVLAGQVEQETCVTLKSVKCWSPRAELKTSREYGFGLGQITKTTRFDVFAELTAKFQPLKSWRWEDRFDAKYQLTALVLYDKSLYVALKSVPTQEARLHMMLAGYNGGLGRPIQDRKLCSQVNGCNPDLWFGHVEKHSRLPKKVAKGYGRSFYQVNRDYVRLIWVKRKDKYRGLV